jgi:hypothetical protein
MESHQLEMDKQLERYMTSPETVPELLLQLHNKGVSFKRIADEIGVTYMAIYRWTKGTSTPRPVRPINEKLMQMNMLEDVQIRAKTVAA